MSNSPQEATEHSIRANGPRLGPKGLAIFIVAVLGSTLGIVAVARLCFPEIIEAPLPVTLSLEGYATPEEVDASIKRSEAGEGEILEPYITVRNASDRPLSSVYMRVNRNFLFHSAEPLEPGGEYKFYLSRFVEADGSRFWPHRYPVDRIEVRGRLPSLKQAILITRFTELQAKAAEEANAAEEAAP